MGPSIEVLRLAKILKGHPSPTCLWILSSDIRSRSLTFLCLSAGIEEFNLECTGRESV